MGSKIKTSDVQTNGKQIVGQISTAASIASPMTKRARKTARVTGMHSHEAKHFMQGKLPISSAVSNTAGSTVENEIVESRLNCRGLNNSRPRYSQFVVRRLISSNSHHTGGEIKNSSTKFLRDRAQSEVPVRFQTNASTTRMYPSHSGKNR